MVIKRTFILGNHDMKRILYITLAFIATYILLMGMLLMLQKKLIFLPKLLPQDHQFQFDKPFEEVFLKGKNATINALFFKTSMESKGIVLYFHGNADNLQRWGRYQADFTSRGYDFFAIDYQGFGKSTGSLGEENMYADAQLAYDWVKERYLTSDIVIYGRSLGTGVASYLATQQDAKMLILETPFNNIKGAMEYRWYCPRILFELDYQFPNDEYLPQIDYPIYIFQGTDDQIVPYRSAEQLLPLLKKDDHFFTIEGGKHKNLNTFEEYYEHLNRILNQ